MLGLAFAATLAAELLLGALLIVSWIDPSRRVWPPPGRASWQYRVVWTLTDVTAVGILALGILDWNTFAIDHWLRLPVGGGLALAGLALALWGVRTLGIHRSSGLKEALVQAGPYRFTRNPQYVGDIVLLLGWAILCNSLRTWIASVLAVAWFALAPFTEEPWLRAQYGEAYDAYRRRVSRYLGRSATPPREG
ncbi:MAG: PEMT/PEM2 methyltransferase family protein [Myxococcota bacterium]